MSTSLAILELVDNITSSIAVICVTKSRTGDYDFRACARARGFRGSTFSIGRIRFAVVQSDHAIKLAFSRKISPG